MDDEYKMWLELARDDLAWTKHNIDGKFWRGVCFTAQQAAEKAIKAYFLKKEIQLSKVHDLNALLEKCITKDVTFESLREVCSALTEYYIPARYPDVLGIREFGEKEANEAYEFAEKIVNFVEDRLK